jgi:hypothetical protein
VHHAQKSEQLVGLSTANSRAQVPKHSLLSCHKGGDKMPSC